MRSIIFITLACLAFFVHIAHSTPVYWAENDHYYELVENITDSWDGANTFAESMTLPNGYTGHLVTITSAEENLWLTSTFGTALIDPGYSFIGAYQTDPNLPADEGWAWVTGESWSFENWGPGEPNDWWEFEPDFPGEYETVVHFWLDENSNGQTWADTLPRFAGTGAPLLIEYENSQPAPVPEPATMLLFGTGLAGLAGYRRRKAMKK